MKVTACLQAIGMIVIIFILGMMAGRDIENKQWDAKIKSSTSLWLTKEYWMAVAVDGKRYIIDVNKEMEKIKNEYSKQKQGQRKECRKSSRENTP